MGYRNTLFILSTLGVFMQASAQHSQYYLGKRNMIGLGTTFYFGDITGGTSEVLLANTKGKRKGRNLSFNYERLVGSFSSVGVSFTQSKWSTDIRKDMYYYQPTIRHVEGKDINVTQFGGELDVTESTTYINLKCYYSSVRPLGLFTLWRLGLSDYRIRMKDDFVFSEYDDNSNTYVDYKHDGKVTSYKHLIWSWGVGFSARMGHDRLLFNAAASLPIPVRISRQPDSISRFQVNHINDFLVNYKLFDVNVGLSYVL